MASVTGNIFLFIAGICIFSLFTGPLSRPAPGGDAAVGYAWSLLLVNFIFVLSMIFAAIATSVKGGYGWIPGQGFSRFLLIASGLTGILGSVVIATLFRYEGGQVPAVVKAINQSVLWLLPLILIGGHFVLLNPGIGNSVPDGLVRWPLTVTACIGVLILIVALGGFMQQSAIRNGRLIKQAQDFEDSNTRRILADIDSCDVSKNLVFILVFTGDNQPHHIQKKAVDKVKTNHQWEAELIRLLHTGWASEVFQFLASNDIDHPGLFPDAIRAGIHNQALSIRESIRRSSHPSHFYPSLFTWEIERVLRTIERFKNSGVDFRPSILELKDALHEPTEIKKPDFQCEKMLDKWLKAN